MNTVFPTHMKLTVFPTARPSGPAYSAGTNTMYVQPQGLFAFLYLMYINVPTDVHDWSVSISTPVARWQGLLEVRDGAATWHLAFKLRSPACHRLQWWAAGYIGWGASSSVWERTVDSAVARMWATRRHDISQLQEASKYWYLSS
jgi:hypothetical protein